MAKKNSPPRKKSWLKRIFSVFCFLLVLLAVVLGIVLAFPGTVAKIAITQAVSRLLGVKITVKDISANPFKGRLELRDLTVYNPEGRGYSSEYAIHLGFVNAELVPFSPFLGKKTIVRELVLKDIVIHYEADLLLNSNLQDIIKNLNSLQSEEKPTNEVEETNTDAERGIEIDLFEMKNVGVYVVAKGFDAKAGVPITFDPMGPFGKAEPDGVSPVELSLHIMGTLLVNISQQAGLSISDTVTNSINSLHSSGTQTVKDMNNGLDDASKSAAGEGKKIIESIKSLF